ncbi:MAG: lysylphosphatidylglycerol synthase transmembrane domain-containing protein [Candidatus Nanohalobium sp.]
MKIGRRRKSLLYFGVATLLVAALIYFTDVQKFIRNIRSAEKLPLLVGVFFGLMSFTILGYTWHRFLNKIDIDTSYPESFQLFMSGQFMNSVTPLGQLGGEPVMAYIVSDTQDTSYEEALSAVMSADIVNTVPFLTFLLGGAAYITLIPSRSLSSNVLWTVGVAAAITAIGGAITYVLWFRAEILEEKLTSLVRKVVGVTGRGEKKAEKLEERFHHLRKTFDSIGEDPHHLISTAAIAHVFFLFQVAALYSVISAVGKTPNISSLYFVVAVASIANFMPTPGGSGAFEVWMTGVLSQFAGITPAKGAAVAVLFRAVTYGTGLVVGYTSLASLRSSGSSLSIDTIAEQVKSRK